jgi:hypothetical protein
MDLNDEAKAMLQTQFKKSFPEVVLKINVHIFVQIIVHYKF